jgi:hypothetical protein
MCSWYPEDLKRMMEMHDFLGAGYSGPYVEGYPYNELLFDIWDQPWDPDLADMVEAVFVQKRGTQGSKEYARLVHHKLLQRIGARASPPLVEYDPSADRNPFSLLEYRCEAVGDVCEWSDTATTRSGRGVS